jgi:hypothetical protein
LQHRVVSSPAPTPPSLKYAALVRCEARMRFADSWVLRDGKIAIHFAGMVQHPDGSLS